MLIVPSGHSLPSIQWWLTLTASEQGQWFSGLMSFAAVVTAIGLATRESRWARADRRDIGAVFASSVVEEILQVRWLCAQARFHRSELLPVKRYDSLLNILQQCSTPVMDLVVSRDIYREDVGRAVVYLYTELLRVRQDIAHLLPGAEMSEAGLVFISGDLARDADRVFGLCADPLSLLWKLTPAAAQPIPEEHEPRGYRRTVK